MPAEGNHLYFPENSDPGGRAVPGLVSLRSRPDFADPRVISQAKKFSLGICRALSHAALKS